MAINRRDKSGGESTIKRTNLLQLLREVHLGGVINECVLDIHNGNAHVAAVDITNSLIVVMDNSVMSKKTRHRLGIGNLDLLIKFLNTIEDKSLNFEVKGSQFQISTSNKSRKLNYLLTEPDLVSTNLEVEDGDPKKKIIKMTELTVELPETFAKNLLSCLSIVDDKTISIRFDGDDEVMFVCGKPHEHQFELLLEEDVEGSADEFNVNINGEHLAHVINIIDFDEDALPILRFGENVPAVVEDGQQSFWALSAITNEDGE